jgi:hypothetical protein
MVNMNKQYDGDDITVTEYLVCALNEARRDILGIWSILASGKNGYDFHGQDLRDFIYLTVKTIIEGGGIVMESAQDRWRCYQHATHYGTDPDEIARNVVAEWVAQGEPEIHGYQGIAFATPDFIDSEDNRRETPRDE